MAYVGALADGWAPSDLRQIKPADKSGYDMRIGLIHAGSSINGVVKDAAGKPLAGAEVLVGVYFRHEPERKTSDEGFRLWGAPGRRLITDAQGWFAETALPPEWQLLRAQS